MIVVYILTAENQNTVTNNNNSVLELECSDLKDELRAMSKSTYALENVVSELQIKMETMKRTFEKELNDNQVKMETMKRTFESEIENETQRSSKLRKKIIKSNKKLDTVKIDLQDKKLQLTVFHDMAAKEEQKKEQREMMENMLRIHIDKSKNGCNIM